MRTFIILLTVFVLGCQSSEKKNPGQSPQSNIEKSEKSPYPTIRVGKGPDALFLTPDRSFLYVANVEDTIISVVDTQNDQVLQNIYGILYPWGFSRLGDSYLVAVSGWDKQVVIIDMSTHEIVKKKRFESNLGGITSSSDGQFIYVINISDKQVLQLNEKLEIIGKFDTGNGPDGIGISKDNHKLYVTNTEDGSISIIDTRTNETTIIEKGGKPELIHANHDNSVLLISNFFKNEAYVLNTLSDEIEYTIENLDGPEDIVMSYDNQYIYVVNFNNRKIYTFSTSDYSKLKAEYIVGNKPIGFVKVNTKAYVSNYGDNTVSVINLENENNQ